MKNTTKPAAATETTIPSCTECGKQPAPLMRSERRMSGA